MDLFFLLKLLYFRRRLLCHDRWSREQLESYQATAFAKLRSYAMANSPFYQRFHQGLADCPLGQLPVLTKRNLMDNFDQIITDRSLKLVDVYSHIELTGNEKHLNKYSITSTSGSTGLKGIFPFGENEWAVATASYLRASEWAGLKIRLTKQLKVAVVGSTTPWHVSAKVGTSLNSWWVPTINLDTADPLEGTVKKLNEFQPRCVMGYPGAIRLLAEQQIGGHLQISPAAIFCTSEVLTEDSRTRILQAFGMQPFNVYAATETGGFASECGCHSGMHLYEDLVITEVVDDHNRPVPDGEYGKKILVTVLASRTLPLIRYEMSDSIKLETEKCGCNLPYKTVGGVQGRKEETVILPSSLCNGTKVRLEPNVFHRVMELVPAAGWQVIQDKENSLRIVVCQPRAEFCEELCVENLQKELSCQNASPEISVDYVDTLQLTETGKTVLIKSLINNKQ